ncbi:hypothetical protein IEQ11_21480 [Lysobacter capsici]|uniref:hypothetical protein n=1 Tax=Lysobacter capsici TaxID=435897 RepID=UPI00177DDC3B|nr:hypothetical protein [Lysobacter capsici]UOF14268.1 hypothetical protein IEQ11_21480 [Lysobacter capsici]
MSTPQPAPNGAPPPQPGRSLATQFAVALLAFLSFGPLTTGLGLLLGFLPKQFPAIQNLYAAGPIAQTVWMGAGVLGILTIVALLRAPRLAMVVCLAFATAYVLGAWWVWGRLTFGAWAAMAAVPLSIAAAAAESRRTRPVSANP